jgi:hypothetical protein
VRTGSVWRAAMTDREQRATRERSSCRSFRAGDTTTNQGLGGAWGCTLIVDLVSSPPAVTVRTRPCDVEPTVAAAIDVVVHLGLDTRGRRRVHEIVGVPGRVENGVVEIADLFHLRGEELVRGDGYPPHQDRFARGGIDLPAVLHGGR